MGEFHPKHRSDFKHYKKCRRNSRVLSKFYDAKYRDLRDSSVKTAVDALTGDVDSVKKLAGSTNTDATTEADTKKAEANLGAASLIMKQNPVDNAKDINDIDTTSNEHSAQDISNNLIKAMHNNKKHSK